MTMIRDNKKWENYDWMDNSFWGVLATIWRYIGPVVIFLFCTAVVILSLVFFGPLFGLIGAGLFIWVVILIKRANQDAMGNL